MNIYIVLTILLSILVLIYLQSYKKLLIQIEKRLSPEEQRSLKENNETLIATVKQLKTAIAKQEFELDSFKQNVDSLESKLDSTSEKNSKLREKIKFSEVEKESIRIDLMSCRKIILGLESKVTERDECIVKLKKESESQDEAVKFAVAKLTKHAPDTPIEQKQNTPNSSTWSGNSSSSNWSICKACGSNSPNLCRCSE
jgi:predicted  nucleic acid-binding Zn-ribbon protein